MGIAYHGIKQLVFCFFIQIILLSTVNAAPADGLVYWNPADKNDSVILSNNNRDIEIADTAVGAVGVRSNRAISQGEGFYYLEITDLYGGSHYAVGVANADAVLQGMTDIPNTASHEFYGTGPDVMAVAVDYRGAYPVVYLMGDTGTGVRHLRTIPFRDEYGPVFLYISAIQHGRAVGGQAQFRLNFGDAAPFAYDPAVALQTAAYFGHLGVEYGWPIDNAHPVIRINGSDRVVLEGQSMAFTATATDVEDGDVSASVNWFLDGIAVGSGTAVTVSPGAGEHILTATAKDSLGQPTTAKAALSVDINEGLDRDNDGLLYFQEIQLGTNPSFRDTDGDGLDDGDELAAATDPTKADHDNDKMTDGYEVANGLNPLLNDADLDKDNDSFSNLSEFQASRRAGDANDYPGHGTVLLNRADASANIRLEPGALSFSVTAASGMGAVRSDIAITPGSGWHYYEGTRLTPIGNFGFGVATATASLTQAAGADGESLGINALTGQVDFNGATVATLTKAALITTYGIAVDYTGVTPDVYVIAKPTGGDYQVLTPITMTGVTGALHIFVYGQSQGVVQQSINAGQNIAAQPFRYSPRYLLYRAGYSAAQTMRKGWGSAYVYREQQSVPYKDRVYLVSDVSTAPTVTVSADGLSAGYNRYVRTKSAVRANQAMKGEFRYWEGRRHRDPINMGFGLNNEFAFIDPYCCLTSNLTGAPPSMSVNALAGIWRNLVFQANHNNANEYYGFAVDYRGDHPTVYVIMSEGVVHEMTLDDFITPIVPMLYGNTLGAAIANSANFGATPFQYDARQALIDYGIDVSDFVPGWGPHQQNLHFANGTISAPTLTFNNAPQTGIQGNALTFSASASDVEDGSLTAQINWSNDQTADVAIGDIYTFNPAATGSYKVTAVVTDSTGQTYAQSMTVMVTASTTVPLIDITIEQNTGLTATVTADGGTVVATALLKNGYDSSRYRYDWSLTDSELAAQGGTASETFTFDPAIVAPGYYQLDVKVTDIITTEVGHYNTVLNVLDSALVLSDNTDSDGDGVVDSDEGFLDSDNDRIPDYLDNNAEQLTQLPVVNNVAALSGATIQSDTGTQLRLGQIAFISASTTASVSMEQLASVADNGVDRGYTHDSGVVDFEVMGLIAGEGTQIVVPLSAAIPTAAVLRLYTAEQGWRDFILDNNNTVSSAPDSSGQCPAPGDALFTPGLTEGHVCIQLSIQDGGVNDGDGEANGVVQVLTGVSIKAPAPVVTVANLSDANATFTLNGNEHVVFTFRVTADSNDADIYQLTISAAGALDEATAVDRVTLYLDADKNGVADPSERLAMGSYNMDNGQVVFTLPEPYQLPVGDTDFLLTYKSR